jgi:hypothetical protein
LVNCFLGNDMKDTYLKGYWAEETLWIYQHYEDQYAIRQINMFPNEIKFFTVESSMQGKDGLGDQPLDTVDTSMVEFISKEEFEEVWNQQKK